MMEIAPSSRSSLFSRRKRRRIKNWNWSRDGIKKGKIFDRNFRSRQFIRERAYGWPSIKRDAKRGIDRWDKDGSGCTVLGLGIMAVIMRSAASFLIVSR